MVRRLAQLWGGLALNVWFRIIVWMNGAMPPSLLQVKYLLLRNELLPEGLASHLVASILAGLAVATTTNPVSAAELSYLQPCAAAKRAAQHCCALSMRTLSLTCSDRPLLQPHACSVFDLVGGCCAGTILSCLAG